MGSFKKYKILISKQIVIEVLRSLHGKSGKHPGITRTMIAYRQKHYIPKMAQLVSEWIMSCEQCIRESPIDRSLTRRPLQNPNEHITSPEDAMKVDLMLQLPPSDGYENFVTTMDVFSRYWFPNPISN